MTLKVGKSQALQLRGPDNSMAVQLRGGGGKPRRRRNQTESPKRKNLRTRNFRKLDEFLAPAPREVRYVGLEPFETCNYADPVVQSFCDITTMQIQSNPKPDFDVASEFERFLDSYRQTFLHSAPLPQKKRKAPGRRKGPTPETSDFKRRFVELSRNTSLSESAKTKKMAKENCVPGASNDVVQREQLRIKKALQRLKVIPTRNLKANRK